MAILNLLLEKKDMYTYIDFRIEHLKRDLRKTLKETEPKHRANITERFSGRILELKELKKTIEADTLKDKSKSYFKDTKKDE